MTRHEQMCVPTAVGNLLGIPPSQALNLLCIQRARMHGTSRPTLGWPWPIYIGVLKNYPNHVSLEGPIKLDPKQSWNWHVFNKTKFTQDIWLVRGSSHAWLAVNGQAIDNNRPGTRVPFDITMAWKVTKHRGDLDAAVRRYYGSST